MRDVMDRQKLLLIRLVPLILLTIILSFSSFPVVAGPDYAFEGEFINVPRLGSLQTIETNQTMPGDIITFNYTLEEGHTYHIYLIGDFVDLHNHKTDYDIFLYRETDYGAKFLSSHTEAAGYPEQVSNDGRGQFFIPSQTGNYYICIRNDPLESESGEGATLMVVERIDLNVWQSRFLRERIDDEEIIYDADWVYEFNTSDPRLKIDIQVPNTLDMYEARLYLMANPEKDVGLEITGVLTPWVDGLNYTLNGTYGGMNFHPQGFRHLNSSDSCEHNGDDMIINYLPNIEDPLLYYLVLLSEYGNGTINVRVQTDFDPPVITQLTKFTDVESGEDIVLRSRIEDRSPITQVSLYYSVDGNKTWQEAPYTSKISLFNGTIPAVEGGVTVNYYWEATDSLGNTAKSEGWYKAMTTSYLTVSVDKEQILGGDPIILTGSLGQPQKEVTLRYVNAAAQASYKVTTDSGGYLTHAFVPNKIGNWEAFAEFAGDEAFRKVSSEKASFKVVRKRTSLSLNVSDPVIGLGGSVNLTGQFSEARVGYEVLIYAKNGFNETTLLALTDGEGKYATVFTPEITGTWSLQAEVKPDDIYTAGSRSSFERLDVGGPTLVKRVADMRAAAFEPPYIYGVGALLGGTIGAALYVARKKGWLKRPGKTEEEPEETEEDEEDFDFDF
ncbi:MAG: hypothetical protein NWE89_07075 [Candidatus Bathyarchaeota archaeon]|nr:hypothetical protein [Candidatus Bathyarchaeota archaeon]